MKQHRLIRYEDGSLEFYDLTKDPSSFENLAGKSESSEIQEGLTKLLPKLQMLGRIDRSTERIGKRRSETHNGSTSELAVIDVIKDRLQQRVDRRLHSRKIVGKGLARPDSCYN